MRDELRAKINSLSQVWIKEKETQVEQEKKAKEAMQGQRAELHGHASDSDDDIQILDECKEAGPRRPPAKKPRTSLNKSTEPQRLRG
jgi:hypothetical protein